MKDKNKLNLSPEKWEKKKVTRVARYNPNKGFIVGIKEHIDSSHFLENTLSKCDCIHGHRWEIIFEFSANQLTRGMVVDFNTLKRKIKKYYLERLDHNILNFWLDQPTAERISLFLFWLYTRSLIGLSKDKEIQLHRVIVYENPDSFSVADKDTLQNFMHEYLSFVRKKVWENFSPEKREHIFQKINKRLEENGHRERSSKRMKLHNPMHNRQVVEKMLKTLRKSQHLKPNKPEQKLIDLFKENKIPLKYVGDGKIIIEGKIPDFIYKNKIVEFFGLFWHMDNNPWYDVYDDREERTKFFKKYGYECLIIDDNDLKNKKELIKKVKDFLGLSFLPTLIVSEEPVY